MADSTGGGFRNDIWVSDISSEDQKGWKADDRFTPVKGKHNSKYLRSKMKWFKSNPGYGPPATWPSGEKKFEAITFDEWTLCQEYYRSTLSNPSLCDEPLPLCYEDTQSDGCHLEATWKKFNMWSPRRGHGAFIAKNAIYVVGGRAREQTSFDDERLVGGVVDHRFETVKDHTTVREDTILKNDVWISEDGLGREWKLLTPGCKDQQEDVMLQTEVWSRDRNNPEFPKYVSTKESRCQKSSDCYGQAECRNLEGSKHKVCVCPMFGRREHHAVAVQHRHFTKNDNTTFSEDYMFIVGGFTSVRRSFCGKNACGSTNSYKMALDDAWVSNDGISWIQFKAAFSSKESFPGRGAHSALLIHNIFQQVTDKSDRLWILGGETAKLYTDKKSYLDDIWYVELNSEPCCKNRGNCELLSHPLDLLDIGVCLPTSFDWTEYKTDGHWSARSGHVAVYEYPSSKNGFQEYIYVVGGRNESGVLSDVWTWNLRWGSKWKVDFDSKQNYRTFDDSGVFVRDTTVLDKNNKTIERESPYEFYQDENTLLSKLYRLYVPIERDIGRDGFAYQRRFPILSKEDLAKINRQGIQTIRDMVDADLYTILKLRGFDYPWEENMTVDNICFVRALSVAFIEKCSVKYSDDNMKIERRHNPRKEVKKPHSMVKISNCGNSMKKSGECDIHGWDGCSPLNEVKIVNVHALGDVVVPDVAHDPTRELEDIHCRQTPKERYMSTGTFVDDKVLIFGGMGKTMLSGLYRDVWQRDDSFPRGIIGYPRPESYTPDSKFIFDSNEEGAISFEYKIFDSTERLDVTPWITTTIHEGTNIDWLDSKKGGPGSGWYIMYVRAIDLSGNRDFNFSPNRGNMYVWYYNQPLPWGTIFGSFFSSLTLTLLLCFEYRRRKKKAALERYALRRLQRKFKLKNRNMSQNFTDQNSVRVEMDLDNYKKKRKKKNHGHIEDTNLSLENPTASLLINGEHRRNLEVRELGPLELQRRFKSVESRKERTAQRRQRARNLSPSKAHSRITKKVGHKGKKKN